MILESSVEDTALPITPEEAKAALRTGLFEDDPALRLTVQDLERAEASEMTRSWILGWDSARTLYQSPRRPRYWSGGGTEAASISFFTVATAVNSIVPQIIGGMFSDTPPFMIEERPGTTAQASRAVGAVLGYQLEDINFREEMRLGVTNACLFGTAIFKWGWETYTKKRKIYKRKTPVVTLPAQIPGAPPVQISDDDIEEVIDTEQVDRPSFEHIVNLREVLVDPGLNVPDIRKAKYVIHRLYMTYNDLDKLRDRPGFEKLPSKEKLLAMFLPPVELAEPAPQEEGITNPLYDAKAEPRYDETTVDPFEQPLEVLERWSDKDYIVVLQKKMVICNTENPYGKIPFLSVGWWDVPEAFWSYGLGRSIGNEQELQQGITNIWLDQATINLNGVYVRVRGKSIPTQSIRIAPGKIIEVDEKGGFEPLARQPAVPEAQQALAMSQARAEQVSGANEASSQGIAGQSGHSNMARSSAGAQILASGASNRVEDFLEKLAGQVMVPFLYEMYEMDRAMLPMSQLKYILNDELQHEFVKDNGDLVDLINARVKFSVLAAAKMQVKRTMAQSLPLLTQYLANQQTQEQLAIQGKKVNVLELTRMYFTISGWNTTNDVIVDMTPQDQQRAQAMNPAAQIQAKQQATTQSAAQIQQQKFENEQNLQDQSNTARAAREVLRTVFEKEATPEALTGEPSATGLGG
jgi:hypothetical protein